MDKSRVAGFSHYVRKVGRYAGLSLAASALGLGGVVLVSGSDSGVRRFGRAAVTGGRIFIDYKMTLGKLRNDDAQYAEVISQVHQRSADRLKDLCCRNGGCFIKVGQHIGTLEYLLPKEYVQTLKILHDNAPETPLPEILKVIEEDLGKQTNELFKSFEEKPIGTASLAQVHKAVLMDGTEVAVKVQHPRVKANSFVDINTMEILVKLAAHLFPDFKFVWLAEETKRNLPLELDFEFEGKNCERVSRMLEDLPFLKVPRIYWPLSSERVLTMEFCHGGRANDLDYMIKHDIPVEEVSNNLHLMYSEMIFDHGFVHCDPHPGNVLVNKTASGHVEIVLLDHGLYTTLKSNFRRSYAKLWLSIINGDMEGIKAHSNDMNCGELHGLFSCMVAGRAWSSISEGKLATGTSNTDEDAEIQANAANLITEMVSVLNKVPREMLLIFKTNDCLRGIDSSLKTRFKANAFVTMSRCCVRVEYEDKIRNCESLLGRWKLQLEKQLSTLAIDFGSWFLRVTSDSKFSK